MEMEDKMVLKETDKIEAEITRLRDKISDLKDDQLKFYEIIVNRTEKAK